MKNIQAFIIGLFAVLFIGAGAANAATWTVTKSINSSDNVCDADCSLREAVFVADSGDTVVFDSDLIGQNITLGGSEIVITKRITIDGFLNDPNVAFISGGMTSRIFYLEPGSGLILKNATLVQGNGKASLNAPGLSEGGAIFAFNASLSLERVALRANTAKFSGAISLLGGTHHFTNVSFTGNTAETNAAMRVAGANARLYMSNTTVSNNHYFVGDNDTFSGAAILLQGGNLIVRNSTITNNSGQRGGGIAYAAGSSSTLDIGNTIVAENTADLSGQDIYSVNGLTITSRGGNLIGDLETVPANTFNQPNDIFGINPLLGPTNANLGGFPVTTHPLQAGSPARNGGLNQNAVDPLTNQPLTTDARGAGFPRIADTTVDKGAFEDQSGNTSLIVTKNANSNDLVCDTDCSLREAVHQAGLNFGTDTITFAPNVFGNVSTGGSEITIQNQTVNIVGYPNLSAETLRITGGNTNRIFFLVNATANISGMTLTNGSGGVGGAIQTSDNSHLRLDKMILRNNFADSGGAISVGGGTVRITNSTINSNSANTVLAVSITNGGTLDMANTTVSGNVDANGGFGAGAIFVTGTANIRNSTIAFNRAAGGTGGGIFVNGTLNIGNTIVSNNIAATSPDIHQGFGTINSIGGNLVQNTNGFSMGTFAQTNDATGVDPLLAALADNGGIVMTHLLMPNSPAINAGLNVNAVDPFDNSILLNDARGLGYDRIVSTVDKGAFETLIPTAGTATVSGRVTNGKSGVPNAQVFITGQNGTLKTTTTNSLGYFSFDEIEVGQIYIVSATSKRFQFNSRVVNVMDEVSDLELIAN